MPKKMNKTPLLTSRNMEDIFYENYFANRTNYSHLRPEFTRDFFKCKLLCHHDKLFIFVQNLWNIVDENYFTITSYSCLRPEFMM